MTYQVADGHNNAGSMADVTPQPATPGAIEYPQIRYPGSGDAVFHGEAYIDLVWTSLERDQYNTLMTQFGLSQTVASNQVTVAIRQDDDTFGNYNGTAIHRKAAKRSMPFWSNLVIRIIKLEAL